MDQTEWRMGKFDLLLIFFSPSYLVVTFCVRTPEILFASLMVAYHHLHISVFQEYRMKITKRHRVGLHFLKSDI